MGPAGEVWATYSAVGAWHFGIILAVSMENTYNLTPAKAGFNDPGVSITKVKMYCQIYGEFNWHLI